MPRTQDSDAAADIESGPPAAGVTTETPYLGVRADYQGPPSYGGMSADATDRWGPQPVTPQYKQGAQFAPHSWSAERRAQMQLALVQVGLIGPSTKFRLGEWDPSTSSAYAQLLSYANQSGLDENTALRQLAQTPPTTAKELFGEAESKPTALHTVQTTAPVDVDDAIEKAWIATHGRKPTARQKTQFRAVYGKLERAPQEQVNAAQDKQAALGDAAPVSTTVDVTQAPSLGNAAEDYAETADPVSAVAHRATEKFESFLKMLGGVV